jgi:hypothetical protein
MADSLIEAQDPDNPTSTANAYIDLDYFQAYCDLMGYNYSAYTDAQQEQSIIRASVFMDARWSFAGYKLDDDQSTECPRQEVYDSRGMWVDGLPEPLLKACAEYAFAGLSRPELLPTPPATTEAGTLNYVRQKLDVLETEKHYSTPQQYPFPAYPLADRLMRQSQLLIGTRRTIVRGD